jgi:hypothetical protein
MELNLVKLVLDVRPEFFPALAPLVSGKGGAFEDAVRQVCCIQEDCSCSACSVCQSCPASILVARNLSSNPDLVRRHQKPALPYLFRRLDADSSEPATVGLTLLGPACSHLSSVLAAVDRLIGKQHCFRSITALDYQDLVVSLDLSEFATTTNLPVLAADALLAQQSHRFTSCRRVQVALQTPLRLVKDMRELKHFDPVLFSRSVVRKISSLIAYYGDTGGDSDLFRYLAERSQELEVVKVYDSYNSASGALRGVTGCYDLCGPFDELGPVLYLGSLLHVGKRASYGMGAFAITPIS